MLLLAYAAVLTAVSPDPGPSAAVQVALQEAGRTGSPQLLSQLERLARQGDASAAQASGEMLWEGIGVSRDPGRACDMFELASGARADSAQNLATCHFRGEGRPLDMVKARQLYGRASSKGLPRANCAFGNMLIGGLGGAAEPTRGLELCRTAAEAGELQAQADYGQHLLTGVAGPRDAVRARAWLTKASERGHANSALNLGTLHWNGDGTPKDAAEAKRWWQVAHKGGNPDAAFLLGRDAFVRLAKSGSTPETANPALLDETLRWMALAAHGDTSPANRLEAQRMIEQLRPFLGRLGRK
jgi:hypothetical protein